MFLPVGLHKVVRNRVVDVADYIDDLVVVRVHLLDKFLIEFSYPGLKTAPGYMLRNWR